MKKMLMSLALLIPASPLSHAMENPKQTRHQCSTACINVCQEVKNNHGNLMGSLQLRLKWGNIFGNPCAKVETEGLENLFVEETPKQPTKKQPIQNSVFSIPKQNQYADVDSLLIELEKDIPLKKTQKPVSLKNLALELTTLVRRGGSQTLSLLKPESTEAACNNLDATCRQLEEKNNLLPDVIGLASEADKQCTEFSRLSTLVAQAATSAQRLATKEPLVNYQDDFTHPFNSYQNEIKLLQTTLAKQK